MTVVTRLHKDIRAVCPIVGVSIGRLSDKASWRMDFAAEATAPQRAAAQAVVDAFDVAAVEAAEQAEQDALDALDAGASADAAFQAIKTMTGADLATFIDTTFPGMTPPQRRVMKLLLHVAALVLRR